MSRLTEAQMRYLHVIYKANNEGRDIRAVDVARALSVTKASVSRMMKVLSSLGLISLDAHGSIALTAEGMRLSGDTHRRAMQVYPFFAEYLGLSAPEAADSAYTFIFGFSEQCVDSLLKRTHTAERTRA